MKKSLATLALAGLSTLIVGNVFAQTSATQNVTLTVNTVYKISTSGNPGSMTVTTGTAGTDALSSVSDNSTTYGITQNFGSTVKLTANLDAALSAGYALQINMASTKGTSAGTVDISNATSGHSRRLLLPVCCRQRTRQSHLR
ncbi:MAG: hypothetical protein HW412_2372 [Bacteroidetes bacterium]|nr:hypothetical protein [Bacteroidota bacterium]